MSDETRESLRDVAEWVRYLGEIGVRELHVPMEDGGPGDATVASGEALPEFDASRATTQPTLSILEETDGILGPPPEDPARRLEEIREGIGECTRCVLHERRKNIVFGVGSPTARLMFIGEGPGADEDEQGEPFVGRAGKKLDEMIAAIGLRREDVYIANIVKCRPPENRTPLPDEVGTCSPFLFEQIAAIRPRVIVTLGSPSTKTLLRSKLGITKLRGTWQSYAGIPVMPTFHPAYLLRAYTKENRKLVWEDLKAARARMDEGS